MRGSTAGQTETVSSQASSALLEFADVVFASVIVTPTVIAYWQSTWTLMDLYILPEEQVTSDAITGVTGYILSLLLCVFQTHISDFSSQGRGKFAYYVLSRLYTIFAGISCIGAVRGIWDLMDTFIEDTVSTLIWTTVSGTILLAALKTLKNICSIPFVVVVDSPRDHFEMPTFFRTTFREKLLYILDCFFSVVIVGTLVTFVWRGLWNLSEFLFYPDDPIKSYYTSVALGYSLAVFTFAVQGPIRWAAARLKGAPRLLLVDANNLVSFIATTNVWRGIWGLLDDYLFPDTLISTWCCHIISLLTLILLNCFNTVLDRGVYFDAEEPSEECVIFPCHYLRLHFRRRKMKLRLKEFNDTDATTKSEKANLPLQIDVQK